MIIPDKRVEDFAMEVIGDCNISRKDRVSSGNVWKEYYYKGTDKGMQAIYNRCYPHIDRMSSYLFSPADVHFVLNFSTQENPETVPKELQETWLAKFKKSKPTPLQYNDWPEMARVAAHYLGYEFHRSSVDSVFAQAVDWALIKGSSFVKVLWGHDGLEPYVIQPEAMGVYREDMVGLRRQQAFCHTSYITLGEFRRRVQDHPDRDKLIKRARNSLSSKSDEERESDMYHQIITGGATAGNRQKVEVFGQPTPQLSSRISSSLLAFHELWVQDDDREDYTTIQIVPPNIVIEGKLRRRNLCGIKGQIPFEQICCNPTEGYFWGNSELSPVKPLQDMINQRISDINRILRLRAKPPRAGIGFSGISEQDKLAADSPGGWLTESQPGAKIESLAPELPQDAFEQLNEMVQMFDDVAGFQPVIRGEGESGVRSGVHAETLVRTSSPRMRDRALMIEKQCSEVGNICFDYLQAKEDRAFITRKGDEFLLSQLPEDIKIQVNSHSSSPAFSEDIRQTAMALGKMGVIDATSILELINPPMQDVLIARHEKAEEEKQKLMAQAIKSNPEILEKLLTGGKKR